MPTLRLPGMPYAVEVTEQQLQQFIANNPTLAAQMGLRPTAPAPTATATNTNTLGKRKLPTGSTTPAGTTDPCTAYENAKRAGQSAAILNALSTKCKAYQEALANAQAFAAQPAPLDQGQLAIMATEAMADEPAQGMSRNLKIGLAVGGGLVLLAGIVYVATR
jgi:hypothetical protein